MLQIGFTDWVVYSIAFVALSVGSYTDIRTREVPDWVNYGLIFMGFFVNILFSITYWDYNYILNSVIGFAVFFILALAMFYTGQWGGGDSKKLMGLGALIGIKPSFAEFPFLFSFLVNTLVVGAVYGLGWCLALAVKNRKKFVKEYVKLLNERRIKKTRIYAYLLIFVAIVLIVFFKDNLTRYALLIISFTIFFTIQMWVFVKAVENSSMYKLVEPAKLTEGDWIAKEVKFDGKYITGPKDLGIEKKQILFLRKLYNQGKVKKILVKEGIPFVPSFLIGFLITVFFGNLILFFI